MQTTYPTHNNYLEYILKFSKITNGPITNWAKRQNSFFTNEVVQIVHEHK